jgi:tungstate transport system substrate-binding protein
MGNNWRRHILLRPLLITSLLGAVLVSGCAPEAAPGTAVVTATQAPPAAPAQSPPGIAAPANLTLILTSTQDSGLLDALIPVFEQQTGYSVKTVAVGTGQALEMGQQGNADVLLVHAPASEQTFMSDGYGKERFLVMHNDFLIAGPAADPARIQGGSGAAEALRKIAQAGATFISRGDKSGTNTKELALWRAAGLDPAAEQPSWYIETGQGMGATLTIASEKQAYTLADRATYLANKDNLELQILLEGDSALLNVYHVMTVNPHKWPKVNYTGALEFAKWITTPSVQDMIGEFGVQEFGEPLFIPDAEKTDAALGL